MGTAHKGHRQVSEVHMVSEQSKHPRQTRLTDAEQDAGSCMDDVVQQQDENYGHHI